MDEAAEVLALRGRGDIDPVDAVVETGGWMTGVLFEAWEAADHVIGLGGEADPLHGYLATEILGQLNDEDAEFLISTAVLTEVTVPRAEALGLASASARMHSLAGARLPVSWLGHSAAMRCHPRFREFLLKRLDRRDEAEQRMIYRAHARLLLSEGHGEEAVEEYLRAWWRGRRAADRPPGPGASHRAHRLCAGRAVAAGPAPRGPLAISRWPPPS